MRLSLIVFSAIVFALAIPQPLIPQTAGGLPKLTTVEPPNGKIGDELTAAGENLAKDAVKEIYFTDGTNDLKLPIISQSAENIKFKIPPQAKQGRFSLMILTTGKEPKLIEQPVKVTVE